MTHVLNFALRKLVSPSIEQKGSSVTAEKLRFDFSHNRAVSAAELQAVETLVNDLISQSLPVSSQVVPLPQALKIHGLRAVFGEIYPDPVRVISVGAEVDDLLANPALEGWADVSVEFCGGTHVRNTGEAAAFVVLEETAVAKGIRRITAVTGDLALEAGAAGSALEASAAELTGRLLKAQMQMGEGGTLPKSGLFTL
eukprot:CAMPEP_0173277276 /NCGR_PEP_ID=MMETSP1143-20121109/3988_1 /TAXON_ID=483371 /ORGANISM="non described non described, Strain CCMP2298" /LENGTH=197 /DNA_ID=CAMNT_0014214345 /DNA_START=147 /DNA_END=740 /DNA_ORIENTATION=-